MILTPGMKVLVAHRRLYEGDHGRYFAGVVDAYDAGLARVTGHTWLRDGYRGSYVRKDDARTKIVSIASGTVIVYQLPGSVDLGSLDIHTESTSIVLRDEHGFEMDLTEGVLQGGEQVAPHTRTA